MRVKKRPFRPQENPCKDSVKVVSTPKLQKCRIEKNQEKHSCHLPKRDDFRPDFRISPPPAPSLRRKSLLIN
jgi:hypothetical protein